MTSSAGYDAVRNPSSQRLAELQAIPICDLSKEQNDELTALLDARDAAPRGVLRRDRFEYLTGIGCSWAACTLCRRSVFTGGSGAEVEWWMDKHPARCPGPQEGPKLVRWQEDVFAQ